MADSEAAADTAPAAVAPNVKLLTRRKAAQQQKQQLQRDAVATSGGAGSVSGGSSSSASVKVELNDSQDESDATPAPASIAAPAATVRPVRSAAGGAGVATRKAATARQVAVKRPIINVDAWSSDDDEEDFAGFEEQNGSNDLRNRHKRIKEEPLSDHESALNNIKLEVKMENKTEDEEESHAPVPSAAAIAAVAAAAAAAAAVSALPARRTPKRIATPPRAAFDHQQLQQQHQILTPPAAAALLASLSQAPAAMGSGGGGKTTTNIADPRYRKPFVFGWKRELVYRAHNDVHRKQYDKAEVYYITPAGKKLRTRADILINLSEGLDANDFTFAREPIGMSPEEEIIRSAKLQTPSARKPQNYLDLSDPDPMLGFGKRVPKPKMPKGASPPPGAPLGLGGAALLAAAQAGAAAAAAQMKLGGRISMSGNSKQMGADPKTPKGTKPKGEPCTIQCVLAMGTIPQLQCTKCVCLFHMECVQRRPTTNYNNYICESCLHESNEPSDSLTIGGSSAASTSSVISVGGNSISITATSGPPQPGTNKRTSIININTDASEQFQLQAAAASVAAAAAASAKSAANSPAAHRQQQQQSLNGGGGATAASSTANAVSVTLVSQSSAQSTAGANASAPVTTWMLPANSSSERAAAAAAAAAAQRPELTIKSAPPQQIAIVAGRKYILVPKTHLMSFAADGSVAIGDSTGIPLHYVDEEQQQQQQAGADGDGSNPAAASNREDGAPAFKKRLLSRSASGKASSSPTTAASNHSPNHSSGEAQRKRSAQRGSSVSSPAASAPTSAAASVHSLFAANFFNNCSTGYTVLMHTFQYLKVQELQRASCVCRLWHQAAHNSALWRTVRMKNSPVNDWSGLVSSLQRNGTQHLDLRKMLLPGGAQAADDAWQQFSQHIGRAAGLQAIDLCRLPARVVERLLESNPALRVLNAVSIRDEHLRLAGAGRMEQLQELRLKSMAGMSIDSLQPLAAAMPALRHLSLTSIQELGRRGVAVLGELQQLESLELGECSELEAGFAADVLLRLPRLQRLRLERGTLECCTFEIVDAVAQMPQLQQLELVNFDIKPDFDAHLQRCRHLRRLLVIPTYISQSATTNRMILNALLALAGNLEQLTWVVTLELLRVTELYVDQCDGKRKDRKMSEDKIPVLKPVPGLTEKEGTVEAAAAEKSAAGEATAAATTVPQVEILPLDKVEKILAAHMPNTNYAIIKLPYHATWRQTMADGQ